MATLGPLLAESGLSNLSFAAILVSALPPKADIQLILGERSANDPKRTSQYNAPFGMLSSIFVRE